MKRIHCGVSVLALLLTFGSMGCVSIRYEANDELLQPCPPTEIPPWQRSKVHLFLMNGDDVFDRAELMSYRDSLAVVGYPKVYFAQKYDREWYRREIHRVAHEDPTCRIILVSYGPSAEAVSSLAFEAARNGVHLDAVVFLDPVGVNGNLAETLPFHTIVVRSHNWPGSPNLNAREHIEVPNLGHRSLPCSPAVDELFLRLMATSAMKVPEENLDSLPRLPLRDKPDPTPRSEFIVESSFLSDRGPFPTIPGGECCKRK